MIDCKTCEYGDTLFMRNRGEGRRDNPFKSLGRVMCSSPKYGKRKYIVNDSKKDCPHYKKRRRIEESDTK